MKRKEFENLSAQDQWLFVLTHKDQILLVELDNDVTYVTSPLFKIEGEDEDNGSVTMKSYLGISNGLFHLFKGLGVECTGV